MRIGGVPLALPALAEPNLALILGGAGSRLEDLVSGYSAFARDGKSATLAITAGRARLKQRPLPSPGSAWIVRRILSGQARPDRDPRAELVQRPVLAWKTGTSYGFRDAWAIGVGPRYLIGVWIGRPDGTPVPGQFGLASAAPLMLQVHDVLTNRDSQRGISAPVKPVPANVGVAAICWPLGQPMSRSDPNRRRQRFAWTLDNTTPPTLQALDQPLSVGLMEKRLGQCPRACGGCAARAACRRTIALWPAPLEPWLPRAERREARLPAADPDRARRRRWWRPSPSSIVGRCANGDQLRLPGDQSRQALQLKTVGLGWQRPALVGPQRRAGGRQLPTRIASHGQFRAIGCHQLSVLDEAGQTAQSNSASSTQSPSLPTQPPHSDV